MKPRGERFWDVTSATPTQCTLYDSHFWMFSGACRTASHAPNASLRRDPTLSDGCRPKKRHQDVRIAQKNFLKIVENSTNMFATPTTTGFSTYEAGKVSNSLPRLLYIGSQRMHRMYGCTFRVMLTFCSRLFVEAAANHGESTVSAPCSYATLPCHHQCCHDLSDSANLHPALCWCFVAN